MSEDADVASAPEAVSLSADEGVAVAEAALAFADAVPPGRDEPYRDLARAAQSGIVPGEMTSTLERVCTLALETGKAHQIGLAEAERLLTAVLRRTPAGRALLAETSDVNRVLGQLAGRTLTSARLRWRMPGRYELDLSVPGFDLTLAIEPEGLEVRRLQSG